jgi:hypothetical protein
MNKQWIIVNKLTKKPLFIVSYPDGTTYELIPIFFNRFSARCYCKLRSNSKDYTVKQVTLKVGK